MTDAPDPYRERAHRLAETFTDREDTTVIVVLADVAEPGASWRAAAALAGASAARRRTLLVNLAGAGSGLDGFLEVAGREGLEAVRSGDRKLSEAAVHPPGRDFLYLPAGDGDPDRRRRPTENEGVLRALRRLAEKIREARGLLLLYLEAGALPPGLAEEMVDGAVPLAGADPHLPDAVPVLGRLAAPAEPEDDEPDEPSQPDRADTGDDVFLPGLSGEEAAGFEAAGPDEEGGTAGPDEEGEDPSVPTGRDAGSGAGEIDLPEPPEADRAGEDGDDEPGGGVGPVPPAGREAPGDDGPDRPGPPPEDEVPDEALVEPGPPTGRMPDDAADDDAADAGRDDIEDADAGDAVVDGDDSTMPERPPAGDADEDANPDEAAAAGPGAAGAGPVGSPDEASPGDGGDDGDDGTGWRRHRRSASLPWGMIAAGVAVVLLLAGGWWWLADRAASVGREAGGGPVAAADSPAVGTSSTPDTAAGRAAEGDGEASVPPASADETIASPPELSHSVLVASFSSRAPARERVDRLRAEQGGTWLLAPTPVRGSLYWRLYAGALADEAAGRELMQELVDRGVKDRARAWDVRPASLAYRLGSATGRQAARERARELRDRGMPVYLLSASSGGDTAWQVYAGAYESREAAVRLGEMLDDAGVEAELVTRRGEESGR